MSGSNGKSGGDHDNGHNRPYDDDALSEAQMELLRHALIEHGKRLGELEAKMEETLQDLLMVKDVVARTHARMKRIAERLGISLDDIVTKP